MDIQLRRSRSSGGLETTCLEMETALNNPLAEAFTYYLNHSPPNCSYQLSRRNWEQKTTVADFLQCLWKSSKIFLLSHSGSFRSSHSSRMSNIGLVYFLTFFCSILLILQFQDQKADPEAWHIDWIHTACKPPSQKRCRPMDMRCSAP